MLLKDFFCTVCGNDQFDIPVDDAREIEIFFDCSICERETRHQAKCNGGMKSRYHFNDFSDDPAYYRGYTRSSPPTLSTVSCDEEAHAGGRGDLGVKYSADRRNERRKKIEFDNDKKRGKIPIYFTTTKKEKRAI